MAHPEQQNFCKEVKKVYPDFFINKKVLDVGSLDINGNNRYLFENCDYTGIDVGPGKNVDIVALGHEFNAPDESYDTIISTECFEHDMHYPKTMANIVRMLKKRGLFLFSCAAPGRHVHGTSSHEPSNSPLTVTLGEEWANYYKNLSPDDIDKVEALKKLRYKCYIGGGGAPPGVDLYFYGIKE